MRETVPFGVASATEISRRQCREPTRLSGRRFGPVAKLVWPHKTAATLAAIAERDQRTAERWLAGEFEPPAIVIAALIVEITRRV